MVYIWFCEVGILKAVGLTKRPSKGMICYFVLAFWKANPNIFLTRSLTSAKPYFCPRL